MSNMSYCRFENTYKDFCDCVDYLEYPDECLSTEEYEYALEMLDLAKRFVKMKDRIEYAHSLDEDYYDDSDDTYHGRSVHAPTRRCVRKPYKRTVAKKPVKRVATKRVVRKPTTRRIIRR